MNYVNVARNIASGKGITQPTLGFNQPRFAINDTIPTPLTAEPPLYPLLIALFCETGLSAPKAALLVSSLGTAAVFLLAYLLAVTLYNQNVGLVAVSSLLFYYPWRRVTIYAWSEPIGIALSLLSLWFAIRRVARTRLDIFLAGFAAGLAFATRYALLPLVCVGAIFLLVNSSLWKRKILDTCLYLAGFAMIGTLVLSRNVIVGGSLMPSFNSFGLGLVGVITLITKSLLDGYLGVSSFGRQSLLFIVTLLTICFIIYLRPKQDFKLLFFVHNRYVLGFWSFGYLLFLVVVRSNVDSEDIRRLVVPAGITLVIIWSALLVTALKSIAEWIKPLVLVLILLLIFRETRALLTTPLLDPEEVVQSSARLTWIARNTSSQDLVIGDDTMDIPFFLNGRLSISFSPYPNTDHAAYDGILAYCRRHCDEYRDIYLILSSHFTDEQSWRTEYGDFFADLVFGHTENYPELVIVGQLSDATVFRILCR
jgi:Dolichyl-phosphate-mannose-protein mannosyltransferase